eukprot:6469508-Amphidinium_carterae.1
MMPEVLEYAARNLEEFLVSIACICVFTGIPGGSSAAASCEISGASSLQGQGCKQRDARTGTGAAMYLLNRNVIMAWIVDADQVSNAVTFSYIVTCAIELTCFDQSSGSNMSRRTLVRNPCF